MADAANGVYNYYKRSLTDYEVERYELDMAYAVAAAKQKNADALAALDAEITALEAEIAAAKTKRINCLAVKDAEICALEAQLAAVKTKCI